MSEEVKVKDDSKAARRAEAQEIADAATTEETRRAALSQEERDAEDKAFEEKKAKAEAEIKEEESRKRDQAEADRVAAEAAARVKAKEEAEAKAQADADARNKEAYEASLRDDVSVADLTVVTAEDNEAQIVLKGTYKKYYEQNPHRAGSNLEKTQLLEKLKALK